MKGYKNAVLTPNKAEFGRLADQLKLDVDAPVRSSAHLCVPGQLQGMPEYSLG